MDVRKELIARTAKSKALYAKTKQVLAAETVSTVAMPHPFYVASAHGSHITDVDGNEYVDLTMGFGPHVLGHAPPMVVKAVQEAAPAGLQVGLHNPHQERLARLVTESVPNMEQVIFANSGTEATLYAVRAVRALSGRRKIALFDGSYHGVHDTVLAIPHRSSSREDPVAFPRGAGVPSSTIEDVQMLPYRSRHAFDLIRQHADELAGVFIEPVQSSNPRTDHREWMHELRQVCRESGVLFVMDEVITGFRLALGGGVEYFDIEPDLATYGKIIGGGMPVGAVAGPAEHMRIFTQDRAAQREAGFEPLRPVFYGTTFSGNPMTMVAGEAQLEYLRAHRKEVYAYLEEQGDRLAAAINDFCQAEGIPARLLHAASMFHLHFGTAPVESSRDIDPSFHEAEREFYLHLLHHGVIVPGIHIGFLSTAHTPQDVDRVIDAFTQSFREIRERELV